MTPTPEDNGTSTVPEQQDALVTKLRQMPPEALPDLEAFLDFLLMRAANPGEPDAAVACARDVLGRERFVQILRELPPPALQLAVEYCLFLAGRSLQWSYDDPASLEKATEIMALDPFMRREMEAVNRDFAALEAGGLENR
jgi:hypothetical protein